MSDEDQIRELIATWIEATKAGDTKTIMGLMTDDVTFLVPGRLPFGKDEFRKASVEHGASDVTFEGKSQILEIKVLGIWAFIITRLSVVTCQQGKPAAERSGHTLTILRKEDGKWLLARDANLLS